MATLGDRIELAFQMVDQGVNWILKSAREIKCTRCGESQILPLIHGEAREQIEYDFSFTHSQCPPSRAARDIIS